MSWTTAEQSPKILTRPLGPSEVDPGHTIGREHWAVNFTATISPRGAFAALSSSPGLLPTLIHYSWLNLRFEHPSIAAHPDSSNTHIVCTIPSSGNDLSEWASQTFVVETDAESVDEVIPTIAPAADARLYYLPQSSELLLHTAHWRMDGVAGMLLLGQLVDLMVSHADKFLLNRLPDPFDSCNWGSEVTRLTPSFEDAGNIPFTVNKAQKAIADRSVGTFGLAAGALGVPYTGDAVTVPSGTRAVELTFSCADKSAITSAAKSCGLGVTAAVHASLATVNFRHAIAEHRGRHYTSSIRYSLRPYLPEQYMTPAVAAGFYSTVWFARADASASWEDHARIYQAEYRNGLSNNFLQAHREYASTLIGVFKNLPTPREPPSEIDISSLGFMEKYLEREYGAPERGFSIAHVGYSVEMLSREGGVFMWTFRDQLTLRLVFNQAFHTSKQMTEFLSDIKTDILTQLQVD
ncbi:hypothetical protein N7478_007446 [Penicillium angulare]|uniref:uncharacterized protein n=1 Tax=Penicillium angulare TaxID=116970 RepID=UPI002541DE89|nr:uncharacterized protein N7478_007446 [Penicillium angulare]KAJ5272321.1 hypothetical protein N7478_007446 [Penicillium angulare]